MAKHTQTIRQQIAEELFECVWPFCEIGAERVNSGSVTLSFTQSKLIALSAKKKKKVKNRSIDRSTDNYTDRQIRRKTCLWAVKQAERQRGRKTNSIPRAESMRGAQKNAAKLLFNWKHVNVESLKDCNLGTKGFRKINCKKTHK